ncbi:MAG: glutamine-hydrolyzing carbamoyl-phosphate synthase small subunit [Proteobacteria bacterium]|nr:glutamine-hydrolyzing carbamoyl-phosphate synthase small subunit [Pseudomonadota bacterium]
MTDLAILALADGTIFRGKSIGAEGSSVGEVVFNTSMTGYQEILTDPSYARQMINLTYPHIGNTGCNEEDIESDSIFATGLIIRDLPRRMSSFRASTGLDDYLKKKNVLGIADIDNRELTRILRDKGAQSGCILAGDAANRADAEQVAIKQAQSFAGLGGMDLAKEVTADKNYAWDAGIWSLGQGYANAGKMLFNVVAYDFGVKHNILRLLVDRGCQLTVVPAQTPVEEVLAMNPDGVFLSNGPGDPEPCDYAFEAITVLLEKKIPVFGICLGHQLMALASGAKSFKMKTGHHGANHPVQELETGKVMITSQNHGFAVTEDELPDNLQITHKSLFDGTIQGVRRTDCPAFSFQGHPEASPGPQDIVGLFDQFIELMEANR